MSPYVCYVFFNAEIGQEKQNWTNACNPSDIFPFLYITFEARIRKYTKLKERRKKIVSGRPQFKEHIKG